jgi:hypothetical protein
LGWDGGRPWGGTGHAGQGRELGHDDDQKDRDDLIFSVFEPGRGFGAGMGASRLACSRTRNPRGVSRKDAEYFL